MSLAYYAGVDEWLSRDGLSAIPFTPDTPPATGPADLVPDTSWELMEDAAVTARTFDGVLSWYQDNTGLEAGIEIGDLVPGSLTSTHDGQVFEGITASHARILHNNVTYTNCRIKGGATYGAYSNPTFNSPFYGTIFRNCIFDGTDANGAPQDKRAVQVSHYTTIGPAMTFLYCDIFGWSSGIGSQGGCVAQYNWCHDFYGSSVEGAHVTSLNARGSYNYFYRNFATSGGSSLMSVYMDERAVHDVRFYQNFLTGIYDPTNNPSWSRFIKAGDFQAGAYNIELGGDYIGDIIQSQHPELTEWDCQFGMRAGGGDISWGSNGNIQTPDWNLRQGVAF